MLKTQQHLNEQKYDKINEESSQESFEFQNHNPDQYARNKITNQKKVASLSSLTKYLQFFDRNFESIHQNTKSSDTSALKRLKKIISENYTPHQQLKEEFHSFQNSIDGQQEIFQNLLQKLTAQLHQFGNQIIAEKASNSGKFKKLKQFTKVLKITEIDPSRNYEVVKLQLQFLNFQTQVCILNQTLQSPFHIYENAKSSGAFGSIYYAEIDDREVAVKCISLANKNHKKSFVDAIKEYFLLLLFSQLKIGPKVYKIGGFDLILHGTCIQFAMEKVYLAEMNKNFLNQVRQNLFQMHMLHVVHRDLKPIHILYSKSYQKYVFVDFGCSDAIDQKIGHLTETYYKGTVLYSSFEVLQLLTQFRGYVDLYYNDFYAIIKISKEWDKQIIDYERNCTKITESSLFMIISMKYHLFHSQMEQFWKLWNKIKRQINCQIEEIQENILDFFSELHPNQNFKNLRHFYFNQILQSIKELPKFNVYKSIFKSQINYLNYYLHDFDKKPPIMVNFQTFYEDLMLNNHNLSIEVIQIKQIIKNRQNMDDYFMEKFNKDLASLGSSLQQNLNLNQIFTVGVYYCCLTQNPHRISVEDKVNLSKRILKVVQKQKSFNLSSQDLTFSCEIQKLQPVADFFYIFFHKVWRDIDLSLKTELMILTVSTLCLLCYPANTKMGALLLTYQAIQHHQNNKNTQNSSLSQSQQTLSFQNLNIRSQVTVKIQFILIFWECKLLLLIFGNIYHESNKQKLEQISNDIQFVGLMSKTVQDLINFCSQEFSEFWDLNRKINESIVDQYLIFDQEIFDQLWDSLNLPVINKYCEQNKKIKRWRSLMYIFLSYFALIYQLKNPEIIMNKMNSDILHEFFSKCCIKPYVIYFIFNDIYRMPQHCNNMFEVIDSVVQMKSLSLKFQINNRLRLSLINKDIQQTKKICHHIFQVTSQCKISKETLEFISSILLTVEDLFVEKYLLRLPHLNEESTKLFNIFLDIVHISLRIGNKCIDNYQNQNKCSSFFQISVYTRKSIQRIESSLREISKLTNFLYFSLKISKIFSQIISFLPKNKGVFKDEEIQFIKRLDEGSVIYGIVCQWFQKVKRNKVLMNMIKEYRPFAVSTVNLLLHYSQTVDQLDQTNGAIKEIFGEISAERYFNKATKEIIPSLKICFDFLLINVLKSNYDLQWCSRLCDFYWVSVEKSVFKINFTTKFIRALFNSFVYTGKKYEEIQLFIENYTQFIKIKPTKERILPFKQNLVAFCWCKCRNCFSREPEGWDPISFTDHLMSKLDSYQPSQNPYMSFVYLYSMANKEIKREVMQKIVKFILKSIPYLTSFAKQLILARIYIYVYVGFTSQPQNMLISLNKSLKELTIESISKQEMKLKKYQRLFYFYSKVKKHQQGTLDTLEAVISKRFFKQIYVKDYVFPLQVKQMYTQKLRRDYSLRENYLQTEEMVKLNGFVKKSSAINLRNF